MKTETQQAISLIFFGIENLKKHIDWHNAKNEFQDLVNKSEDPDLWLNPQNAQELLKKKKNYLKKLKK